MKKDEVWARLKSDDAEVYGQSMLDMFLKTTNHLERRHLEDLPESKRNMVNPQMMLNLARTPAEAERAMKKGASDLWTAAERMIDRDDPDTALFLIARLPKEGRLFDPEQTNKNTFLGYAIEGEKTHSVRVLIAAGAKPSDDDLESAAAHGGVEIAKELLKHRSGLDIHRALDQAARVEDFEVFKFLADELSKEPDYEPQSDLGMILRSAAHFGRVKKLEFLLDRGAGGLGDALESATKSFQIRQSESLEVIKILLGHRAEAEDAILWASVHLAPPLDGDRVLDALTSTPTSLRTAQRLARRSRNVQAYLDRRAERTGEEQ